MRKILFALILSVTLFSAVSGSAQMLYADDTFSKYSNIEYEPYDYFDAKYNSSTYKSTYAVANGVVDLVYGEGDVAAVFFNISGDDSQQIFFFVEGADLISNIHEGDRLAIKCLASGDTTEIGMPVQYPTIYPITIEKL